MRSKLQTLLQDLSWQSLMVVDCVSRTPPARDPETTVLYQVCGFSCRYYRHRPLYEFQHV